MKAKLNCLVSGGTGTGKTTTLNVLSSFIPADERVVTIEDAAELQLQQRHVVRLETRPPNIEGKGEVLARDLVKNALRMRPDRIVIGECRGGEVLDMLQAMNTGHEGSMTTVHANTPRDALSRVEAMVGMGGIQMSEALIRQTIARSLNVIIQLSRGTDGKRRITSISEITDMQSGVITMQEIFKFEQHGVDAVMQGSWHRCCDGQIRKLRDCCTTATRRINGDAALRGYCYGQRSVFCVTYQDTGVPC